MKPFIPAFSGNPEDLQAFVTMILEDMSLETLAYYAVQNYASDGRVTESGYCLPPAAGGGVDAVAGIDTDFPMTMHLGQTFDHELLEQIGSVMAEEQIEKKGGDPVNSLYYSAVSDVRVNPLCGRYYEGFSEDPYLTAELAGSMVRGAAGEAPFYLKSQMAVKHFTVYQAEWNREDGTNDVSNRALHEWHYPPFRNAVKQGAVGVMTSYGATNEIPNCFSPFINELNGYAPFHLYNVSDFGADSYTQLAMGKHGQKTYAENGRQVAGLMIKAGAFSNNIEKELVSEEDYQKAIEESLYGLNRKDLEELIRPQIELWVRSGYFNRETYPYAKGKTSDKNAENPKHQELSRRAGREGLVLLKNEGRLLPLEGGRGILVTGIFADMRTQPMYAAPTPAKLKDAGTTPIEMLKKAAPAHQQKVIYAPELSARMVRLKVDGSYLTVRTIGGERILTVDGTREEALCLQVFDWGQDAYSFVHLETETVLSVEGEGYARLVPFNRKQIPPVYTYERNADGTRSIRADSIIDKPYETLQLHQGVPFYRYDSIKGRYLIRYGKFMRKGRETGRALTQEIDRIRFVEETVALAGEGAAAYAHKADRAVVLIGEEPRINASEMKDRQDMSFGRDQVELVKQIAKVWPGRTVVVVRSDFPMDLTALQEEENVGAILLLSYAGEFDSSLLAEALFGDFSPSGRLSTTWHRSIASLPRISDDMRSDSRNFVRGQYCADQQYTVDMKATDAEEYRLTYQYMDNRDILYPFGYGLSYGAFDYENIRWSPEDEQVEFTLVNRGRQSSDEVVQLYARVLHSGYGMHVPVKQLAGFARLREVAAGERRNVKLSLDRKALERWDAARQRYIFEGGLYEIYLGRNAKEILWSRQVLLQGETLGEMNIASLRNIWEICAGSRGLRAVEASKERTALREGGGYFAVESKRAGSWLFVHKAVLRDMGSLTVNAAYLGEGEAELFLYTGKAFYEKKEAQRMRGEGCLAKCAVRKTQMRQYWLDAEQTMKVVEPIYEAYGMELEESCNETVDLYFVFSRPGVRLESISGMRYN